MNFTAAHLPWRLSRQLTCKMLLASIRVFLFQVITMKMNKKALISAQENRQERITGLNCYHEGRML
jgi:hypothetical protein